jgi:hypothetical protein
LPQQRGVRVPVKKECWRTGTLNLNEDRSVVNGDVHRAETFSVCDSLRSSAALRSTPQR